MIIRILGAHHVESGTSKYSCFVIDGALAVDAGALTSTLSAEEQRALKGILVTHAHFDHIRDIPSLAINLFGTGDGVNIYATEHTKRTIESHLLNDVLYPNFFNIPANKPTLTYREIVPGRLQTLHGYSVLPLFTNHCDEAMGYNITDTNGDTLFYSGDTGPGLSAVWSQIEPQMLVIEVTMPNSQRDFAIKTGHLTPELLRRELEEFRQIKGYLPNIVTIHMDRITEEDIRTELEYVSESLNTKIVLAHEGMEISLQKEQCKYNPSGTQVPIGC